MQRKVKTMLVNLSVCGEVLAYCIKFSLFSEGREPNGTWQQPRQFLNNVEFKKKNTLVSSFSSYQYRFPDALGLFLVRREIVGRNHIPPYSGGFAWVPGTDIPGSRTEKACEVLFSSAPQQYIHFSVLSIDYLIFLCCPSGGHPSGENRILALRIPPLGRFSWLSRSISGHLCVFA